MHDNVIQNDAKWNTNHKAWNIFEESVESRVALWPPTEMTRSTKQMKALERYYPALRLKDLRHHPKRLAF